MGDAAETAVPTGVAVMGRLLQSAADLPRSPSTDVLALQAFLHADLQALRNPELRGGLAAYVASVRHPEDAEARARDAAQWEALLADPVGQQLLGDTRLAPEQRLAHLAFFLLRPELPLEQVRTYAGHLARVAAHEAQLALRALDPEQVAPIARPSEALVRHLPELAALLQPLLAQTLAELVPDTLAPTRAADVLDTLAGLGGGEPTPGEGGDTALASLHAALSSDPALRTHLDAYLGVAAEGLRALAASLRAEPDARQVAQALVLGGLQHQAFLQNVTPFVESALAQPGQAPGTVEENIRAVASTSVRLIGMAMGGPVGAAAASTVLQAAFRARDTLREIGRFPFSAVVDGVSGASFLGLVPEALGEAAGELTQFYASQLGVLSDEALLMLGDVALLLTAGEVEGLADAWASLLGDPKLGAELQETDPQVRAELLRCLLVGGAVGAFSWDAVAPGLHALSQTLLGRDLPADVMRVAEVYAASAALAVTALGDDELREQVAAGSLASEEAVTQAEARGVGLFVGAHSTPDTGLAAAMLQAMVLPKPPQG